MSQNYVTEERLQQFAIDLEQKLEQKLDEKLDKAITPINNAIVQINKTLEVIQRDLQELKEQS